MALGVLLTLIVLRQGAAKGENPMFQLIADHQIGATLIAGYAGLSFVNALPQPVPAGSVLYRFFYDFVHAFWLNVMKIRAISGLLSAPSPEKPAAM